MNVLLFVLFIVGVLLIGFALYIRSASRPNREVAAVEAEMFQKHAAEARESSEAALCAIYEADARAEAEGREGLVPSVFWIVLLVLGTCLVLPQIITWIR